MEDDPILSTRDIAREWGVHLRTVQRWIESGRLPTVRTEGRFQRGIRLSVAKAALGERITPKES